MKLPLFVWNSRKRLRALRWVFRDRARELWRWVEILIRHRILRSIRRLTNRLTQLLRLTRKRARRLFVETYRQGRKRFRYALRHIADEWLDVDTGPVSAPIRLDGGVRSELPFGWLPAVQELADFMVAARSGNHPIVVGPWFTEIGFELLYWIPFVSWFKRYTGIHRDRLVVVSRGGVSSWYEPLTPHYVELLDFFDTEEYAALNKKRVLDQDGRQKHITWSAFDQEILNRVKQALGWRTFEVLHPALMYRLFDPFWMQRASLDLVRSYTLPYLLSTPRTSAGARNLPTDYVAVKFYENDGFPYDQSNQKLTSRIIRSITQEHDVVILNTGLCLDEHADFLPEHHSRIHTISEGLDAKSNLETQTQVIGGASAYVGTYGGFSYLAPFQGIDAFTIYSEPERFRFDHMELALRTFARLGGGELVAVDSSKMSLLGMGLGPRVPG